MFHNYIETATVIFQRADASLENQATFHRHCRKALRVHAITELFMFIAATVIHLKTFITFFQHWGKTVILHVSFSGGTQLTCQAHAKASTSSCCTSFASLVQFVLRLMNLECSGYFDLWQCIFQGQQSHQMKLNISVPVLTGKAPLASHY